MTEEEIALQEELILQEASTAPKGEGLGVGSDRPAKLTALLKDLMQQRSMSPTQLATALDLNPSNVTGFLQGKKNPTLSTIDRIAAALAVPAWMLLSTPTEVIADLRAAGLLPPEPAAVPDAAAVPKVPIEREQSDACIDFAEREAARPKVNGFSARVENPAETRASGLPYDLLTIDPLTGETHRYRMIRK